MKSGIKQVEFSAYAFNDDRVKSTTHKMSYKIPEGITQVKGSAYLLAIGVNTHQNPSWDLQYAANDARIIEETIYRQLTKRRNDFRDIVPISLISDQGVTSSQKNQKLNTATKDTIKAVFQLLSGKTVDKELFDRIPNANRIKPATPDDLLLISFSGHGYKDEAGRFHLFPFDIGPGSKRAITPELLKHTVSSDDLSLWLRDVDAGDMVMIIDACNSAASVEGKGFKPGPMGSRGLGQLAYNKGMRILAASQAEDVALESDLIRHGVLTYALIKEGIDAKKADHTPADDRIMIGEWLSYGEQRVPKLYAEIRAGKLKDGNRGALEKGRPIQMKPVSGKPQNKAQTGLQQPSLFDFTKKASDSLLMRILQ